MIREVATQSAQVFQIVGRDAPRYLHARTTAQVKDRAGVWSSRAAVLTAQGRVMAVGSLLRIDGVIGQGSDPSFLYVTDGGEALEIEAELRRFIVADRVTISNVSDAYRLTHWGVSGGEEGGAPFPLSEWIDDDGPCDNTSYRSGALWVTPHGLLIPHDRFGGGGLDLVWRVEHDGGADALRRGRTVRVTSGSEAISLRALAGIPQFPDDVTPGSLFSEYGLAAIVAPNKGCYVGQEVVERVEALGRAPQCVCAVECLREDGDGIGEDNTLPQKGESIRALVSSPHSGETVRAGELLALAVGELGGARRALGFARFRNDPELLRGSLVCSRDGVAWRVTVRGLAKADGEIVVSHERAP